MQVIPVEELRPPSIDCKGVRIKMRRERNEQIWGFRVKGRFAMITLS
jgi:hypothetical protein